MKIHVFRGPEVSGHFMKAASDIVKKSKSPAEFIFHEGPGGEDPDDGQVETEDRQVEDSVGKSGVKLEVLSWETLFGYCEKLRADFHLHADDYVVYMTAHGNSRNWFSSMDEGGRRNFFIQTSGWRRFVEGESVYPVIYELVTIPLMVGIGGDLDGIVSMAHPSRGCPFDYCRNKSEVLLRLRTADLCQECKNVMIEKGLKPDLARQIFELMDEVRLRLLFRSRLQLLQGISPLDVNTRNKRKLVFTGYGVDPVGLSPVGMTLYLLFLRHPEGISLRYRGKYKDDIKRIYGMFSDDDEAEKINTVEVLTDQKNQALSQGIKKVNDTIKLQLEEKVAEKYLIFREKRKTAGGALKWAHVIKIDRNLVTINGEPFETGIRRYFPR